MNFTIPKNLLEKIDETARQESRTRAELLREAVRLYISGAPRKQNIENDPMRQWQKRQAKKLANWDAVADIRRMRDTRWNLSSTRQ